MKRCFVITACLLAALWLTACSGEGPSTPSENEDSRETVSKDSSTADDDLSSDREASESDSGSPSAAGSGPGQSGGEPGDRLAVIDSLSFEPSDPSTGDTLKVDVDKTEEAGPDISFLYRWSVNGEMVQDTEDNVLAHPVQAGDFVEVEVTPTDGFERGPSKLRSVRVANAYPEAFLAYQNLKDDGSYEAQVNASDPDGDPVRFSLKQAPPGMSIDSSGRITWTVQPGDAQSYDVEVSVQDDKGAGALLSYQVQIGWKKPPQGSEENANSGERQ